MDGGKFCVRLNTKQDLMEHTTTTKPTETIGATPAAPVTDEGYYVAGCKELCGVNWEPNAAANKMTEDKNSIYKKVYKTVPKGAYQLKMTNGSWD